MLNKNVVVADIDGCCVFSEDRIKHLLAGDEETYHEEHVNDTPIQQGVEVYRMFLANPNYRVLFVTGRMEKAREYTLKQLNTWVSRDITCEHLLMRPNHLPGDKMHDTELKPMLLRERGITPEHIFMVFEDRSSMVKTWRSMGVVVYQTDAGEF